MAAKRAAKLEFSHFRLLTANFSRAWRFYRDVLGLSPGPWDGRPPYAEFKSKSGAIVSIFDRKEMAEAVGLQPGRYASRYTGRSALIFATSDVDKFAERLRRKRVRLLKGPTNRPKWGLRTIHLRDPDGYLIEIYSPIK